MERLNRILENYKNGGIEYRAYMIFVVVGVFATFLAGILSIVFNTGSIVVATCFIFSALALIFVFLSQNNLKHQSYSLIILICLSTIFFPIVWIFSAGSFGTGPFLYLFNFVIIAVLLSKKKAILVSVLNALVFGLLLIFEGNFPDKIIYYESELERLIDFWCSVTIVGLSLFLMVYRIMKDYHRKINELEEIQYKLNDKLIEDDLSRFKKHAYIIHYIEEILEKKEYHNLVILLLDIDKLGILNKEHGYHQGDRVIAEVSDIIRNRLDDASEIARLNEDKFIIVFMNKNLSDCEEVADNLCKEVQNIKLYKIEQKISISIGIYETFKQESLNNILQRVTGCVRLAKSRGGNQYVTKSARDKNID